MKHLRPMISEEYKILFTPPFIVAELFGIILFLVGLFNI